MGDVCDMKRLKQRFAIRFSKAQRRYGTPFAERFKAVLAESTGNSQRMVVFCIDFEPCAPVWSPATPSTDFAETVIPSPVVSAPEPLR